MDTKSKNTKINGTLILSVGWIAFLWLVVMLYGEIVTSNLPTDLFSAILVTGIIYALLLIGGSIWVFKKCKSFRMLQERKIDRLNLEIIIAGILLTILGIIWLLPWYHPHNWMYTKSMAPLYLYLISEVLWAALLYIQIVLLIRKIVLHKRIQAGVRHRKKKPVSAQGKLLRYYHGQGIFIGIVCTVIALLSLYAMYTENYWSMTFCNGIICVLILLLVICYVWQSGVVGDIGKLAQRIHELESDSQTEQSEVISKKSMLYEAACELENIHHTLEDNVEKRIRSERLKVDLITNVSHDLKTPLTSMVGYTELLKKEELTPAAKDYVEIIADKQEKLAEMIQDLFELSKATSHSEQLNIQVLDMNRLVEQIMTDMEDTFARCECSYVKKLAEESLPFLGDNTKMYRVVQNILENTTKYAMPGTRVFVETSVKQGNVQLQVKNTASYIMDFTPEDIKERFVRGDKSRTTEGHGLGLAIAESLLENMDGKMKIEIDGDVFKVLVELKEVISEVENQG